MDDFNFQVGRFEGFLDFIPSVYLFLLGNFTEECKTSVTHERAITLKKENVGIKSVASWTSRFSKFPFSHNTAPSQ